MNYVLGAGQKKMQKEIKQINASLKVINSEMGEVVRALKDMKISLNFIVYLLIYATATITTLAIKTIFF